MRNNNLIAVDITVSVNKDYLNNFLIVARKYGSIVTVNGVVNVKGAGAGLQLANIFNNYPNSNISFPITTYDDKSGTARINTEGFLVFDIPSPNKDYYFCISYCK